MFRWRMLLSWCRTLFRRSRVNRELDEELRFHLDEEIAVGLRAGLTLEDARRRAHESLGGRPDLVRERCQDARGITLLDDFARDLRYAARLLVRNPRFTAVVVATLAIAIGAAVTVFSIVDAWLIKPLRFPDADRLVVAFAARPERPREPAVWLPYRTYTGLKERSRTLSAITAAFVREVTVTRGVDAQAVLGLTVTHDFFPTFGVAPLYGRALAEWDASGPPVVVLTHGFWQRHFGGSPQALGATLIMSGVPHEVVGVMPSDFDVRVLDMQFDFWAPLRVDERGYTPGGIGPVAVIGRLHENVTMQTAEAEIASIMRDIEISYQPNFNGYVAQLSSLQADNTRTVRTTLLTIAAAVAGLLLMTAVNVGTLLLGRGLARMRETAIRAAIGCGRARLVRQFLTESLLLACLGGLGGIALASAAVMVFTSWDPLATLPANPVGLDLRALASAITAMGIVTIVSGALPAMRISRAGAYEALRAGGDRGMAAAPAQRAQLTMLAVQVSVTVILLVVSALMTRTFARLQREPLGFEARGLLVATVVLPDAPFDSSEKRNGFYRAFSDRLRSLPGVRDVSAGTTRPLHSGRPIPVLTSESDPRAAPRISAQAVTAEFFQTLGVATLAGRPFDARDGAASAPVVVLNERAARELFGDAAAAVGNRVRVEGSWREVVGVVGNVRSTFFNTLEWLTDPILYRPALQALDASSNPMAASFMLYLHVRSNRELSLAEIRSAAAAVNSSAAVTELRTAPELVAQATRQPAFRMTLLIAFAAISLLLAAIGTFGLVSQAVAERRREIAIRLALGGRAGEIVRSVTQRAVIASLAGLLAGVAATLPAARVLESLLYGVRPHDTLSFAAAAVALLLAAVAGAILPSLRAVRIDPVHALRAD